MDEYIKKWSVLNRLIDLENEFQKYKPFHGFEHAMYRKICEAEIAIGKTQASDVAPVRHGRWVKKKSWNYSACSRCSFETKAYTLGSNFCPNCGAKMDGGEDHV